MRQLTRRCNFPSYWLQIPRNDATLSIFLPTPSVCCLYSLREHLCLTLTIFPSELIKAAILQKNSFCALPPHPAKAFMCPFSDLLHSYLGLAHLCEHSSGPCVPSQTVISWCPGLSLLDFVFPGAGTLTKAGDLWMWQWLTKVPILCVHLPVECLHAYDLWTPQILCFKELKLDLTLCTNYLSLQSKSFQKVVA